MYSHISTGTLDRLLPAALLSLALSRRRFLHSPFLGVRSNKSHIEPSYLFIRITPSHPTQSHNQPHGLGHCGLCLGPGHRIPLYS